MLIYAVGGLAKATAERHKVGGRAHRAERIKERATYAGRRTHSINHARQNLAGAYACVVVNHVSSDNAATFATCATSFLLEGCLEGSVEYRLIAGTRDNTTNATTAAQVVVEFIPRSRQFSVA